MHLKIEQLEQEIKQHRKINFRLTRRLLALVELAKVQCRRSLIDSDYRKVAAIFEVTPRTIYNWKQSYDLGGVRKLAPRNAPGRRADPIRGWNAKIIKEMRLQFNWGAEVIQAHLREHHGVKITRGKIHRFLRRKGLLTVKKKTTKPKYHTKIVKVFEPGEHTQMDVKYLPYLLPNKKKCYVYNFVDHASRWQFKMVFESYCILETEEFMQNLLSTVPFKIKRLQTDNGSEFTNTLAKKFAHAQKHILDEICEKNKIIKKLIPIGEKELNGLVERSHRQDDNQLYNTIKPRDIEEFKAMLKDYCTWNNDYRLRRALGWISANRYLKIWSSILHKKGQNEVRKEPLARQITAA